MTSDRRSSRVCAPSPPHASASAARRRVAADAACARVPDGACAGARRDPWAAFDAEAIAAGLAGLSPVIVEKAAPSTGASIWNALMRGAACPDSSRMKLRGQFDGVVVLADGLSARAAQAHGAELSSAPCSLATPGWNWGRPGHRETGASRWATRSHRRSMRVSLSC